MSHKAHNWAWNQETKTPLTQLLLSVIAELTHAEKEFSWASHNYLADKCRCSRRSIISNLEYLEREKYITVERRTNEGIKTTSIYRMNYSRCEVGSQHDVKEIHKGSEGASQGGSEGASHKLLTSLTTEVTTDSGFDTWWSVYPKKKGKQNALKAWNKIKPDADMLIAHTTNMATNDDEWVRGFAPHPTTYLNQARWNDEVQQRELTQDEQHGLRKQRTAAILQELNGGSVGCNEQALLPPMDEGEWGDRG